MWLLYGVLRDEYGIGYAQANYRVAMICENGDGDVNRRRRWGVWLTTCDSQPSNPARAAIGATRCRPPSTGRG